MARYADNTLTFRRDLKSGRFFRLTPPSGSGPGPRPSASGSEACSVCWKDEEAKNLLKITEEDLAWRFSKTSTGSEARILIVSVNVWCETPQNAYPAEIGLTELTIKDGITNRFCQLLKTHDIPVGHRANMMSRIENNHQIDFENEFLTSNYTEVFKAILDIAIAGPDEFFLGQNYESEDDTPEMLRSSRKHRLLPICVMPEERKTTQKVFRWLANLEKSDVEFVFFNLDLVLSTCVKYSPLSHLYPREVSVSHNFLKREICMFTNQISCEYHELVESMACACSRATRYALIFCDIGYQSYDIAATFGQLANVSSQPKNSVDYRERLSTIDLVGDFNHPMNYFVTYDEVSKNFVWNRRKGIQES